jgi:hypothetical protein
MPGNFDGSPESDAILTLAATLFGGRFTEGLADDAHIALNSDGTVQPFGVVLFGDPIPAAGGRGVGLEATQPFVLPVSFILTARDSTTARAMAVAVMRLFLDFQPSTTSGTMAASGGYSFTTRAAVDRPSRFVRTRQFTVRINL